ncbi:MAG: heme lyase CcmF/NrfE family subunit [Dehalogenimonas sp.]|uniref:Heme lyase CcmF/NrfE family subunit n=1 Tax=Candidatus Dehalogenimonas loeffleri TaxID=3127115 RepID=A0ABZ2J6U9_9CHLR|nr:heme lyase CcmF/NrfE family subunit [Dehalogenimonas sp.]
MADIGYIALFLALAVSVYSVIAFIVGGIKNGNSAWFGSARNSLLAATGLITIAVGVLWTAILTHQFNIEYVAQYTSTDMPLVYLISTLWAGNDGSLLFWAWLLSIFAAIVVLTRHRTGQDLVPIASAVMMFSLVFFLVLLVVVANPFDTLSFTPLEGNGLNPLLENIGMVVHPPTLLFGYVGFTVPFAFAIAALVKGRASDEWLVLSRRWALITWLILGLGLVIGMWWAYVELGWGGYWAWDPVENAGLMPWLLATAFLHSIKMQRRRGMFKVWNMLLIIGTFGLSIFGTFLTRSGLLSSVHTFGETGLEPYFLTFLGVTILGALGLLAYRSRMLRSETEMESFVSRESTFLLNNLLFVGATIAVFVGTMFPAISELFGGSEVTLGANFFNQVNGPIFLAIVALAGICTLIGWRKASNSNLIRNFLRPLIAALVLAVVLFALGVRELTALAAYPLLLFVLMTILTEWLRGANSRRKVRNENFIIAFLRLIWSNKPRYGGYIIHLGILVMTMGIIGSSVFDAKTTAVLNEGETVEINQYALTFDKLDFYTTPSRDVITAGLAVTADGKDAGHIIAEKIYHYSFAQPVTEVGIIGSPIEDLYVIFIDWDETGAAAFEIRVIPLVLWVWIGGMIIALGGVVAFWPERRAVTA